MFTLRGQNIAFVTRVFGAKLETLAKNTSSLKKVWQRKKGCKNVIMS